MLKNISQLEVKIGEKEYRFLCDMDSPLDQVRQALFTFQQYCEAIEAKVKEHNEMMEKQKAENEALSKTEEVNSV